MKKLVMWRLGMRDGAAEVSMAEAAGDSRPAGLVAPIAELPQPLDDEVHLLRQAAMLQHEDTVPAAFYRAQAD